MSGGHGVFSVQKLFTLAMISGESSDPFNQILAPV
jgi:hypothetical protein